MTEVVAALIWQGDKFMICQRPAHKARGLLWEFVGIQIDDFAIQKMRCRPFVIELCVRLTIHFRFSFANNHIPLTILEQRVTSDI